MARYALVLIACLTLSQQLIAQAVLPRHTLDELKRGTVFVRAPGGRSGSGFVVAVEGNQVYCVTNAHVAGDGRRGPDGAQIVLDSGTKSARTLPATVVALDAASDLAVLSFTTDKPPKPLRLAKSVDVPETTPVYVVGFPFGQMLSAQETPAVTVSRASIAAQRRDKDGIVEHLQLDGELNPGNSGGPLVGVDGQVLGVAMAKLDGTNISFGISIVSVRALLHGRISSVNIRPSTGDKTHVEFSVEVRTLDPLNRITKVSVLTALADRQAAANIGEPGAYNALVGGRMHKLHLENGVATGKVRIPRHQADHVHMFQIKLTSSGTGTVYTEPAQLPAHEVDAQTGAQHGASAGQAAREPAEDFGAPEGPLAAEEAITLPAEVEHTDVAGGGRYLVLKLRDTPALVIVDTFAAKVAKYIGLPSSNFLYGAGGNRAVVYLPDDNVLHSYDLSTFERRKVKPNPFGPLITNIIMGHSRGGRAIVRHAIGTDQLSRSSAGLLDTIRLTEIQLQSTPRQAAIPLRNRCYRDRTHFRSNGNLTMITEWATSHSPQGLGLLVWRGNAFEHRYDHRSDGYLAIGDDERVYCGTGRIYNSRLDAVGQIDGQPLVPGLGGIVYLSLSAQGKLTVYQAGETQPIGVVGDFPDWKPSDRHTFHRRDRLSIDQRITFIPQHGRIAFITQDDTKVVIRNFDFEAALGESGVDYLVVLSRPTEEARAGKTWSYQLDVISRSGGIEYSLELAPEGMEISDSGFVSWKPTAAPVNPVTVVILIKDRSGEESFHRFDVPFASD